MASANPKVTIDGHLDVIYKLHMFEIRQTPVFSKWFADLKNRAVMKIIAKRLVLMEAGHMGDAKQIGGGVSELRVHFGAGYRIYYTRGGETIILLLCGGDKGSQARDIKRAQKLVKEMKGGND